MRRLHSGLLSDMLREQHGLRGETDDLSAVKRI
jgi:hypothetical protein